jgi:hypothetical protein
MKKLIMGFVALLALCATNVAQANDFEPQIKTYFEGKIKSWLNDPAVISAIKAQNEKNAALDEAAIDTLDKQWRAEAKAGGGDLVNGVLANALSKFLTEKKNASDKAISEVFVMDNKGLNVGQSDVTSDYMQGDEAKWQKTFGTGGEAVFIDDVEFDESSQTFQSQVSATIMDGGQAIGAITIGLNVESLM